MPEFEHDGASIHYERTGSGTPALVMIHGLTCALDDWAGQRAHFSHKRTTVALDLRGHGRSNGYPDGFDMATMAADVAALLEALDPGRAVLVGHSMGCRVALQAACLTPEHTAGVILVDGSRFAVGDPEAARRTMRGTIDSAGYAALVRRLFDEMFTQSSDPAHRARITARALAMPEATGRALMENMCAWDAVRLEDTLQRLTVPVLAIQSTHVNEARERVTLEPGDTTPYIALVAERTGSARIEVVPGTGHFTMIDARERTNELIEEFLATLS